MADEKRSEQTGLSNQISEETGQFDARFVLWRLFCAENSIPVETLPSELRGEIRQRWEKLKDRELHKPAEESDG